MRNRRLLKDFCAVKVCELENILKQFPSDMSVIVAGYEGGYNDISATQECYIRRDVNTQEYMGAHDDAGSPSEADEVALLLTGQNQLAKNG